MDTSYCLLIALTPKRNWSIIKLWLMLFLSSKKIPWIWIRCLKNRNQTDTHWFSVNSWSQIRMHTYGKCWSIDLREWESRLIIVYIWVSEFQSFSIRSYWNMWINFHDDLQSNRFYLETTPMREFLCVLVCSTVVKYVVVAYRRLWKKLIRIGQDSRLDRAC